jgi:DNA-binding transcriptional LysR family regulator
MNWDDLKYVLAVSRARSFQRAAGLLKVSHTTVGRRISGLEARLGVSLFEHAGNQCLPTHACRSLLGPAQRMESEALSVRHTLSTSKTATEGSVQITTMGWIINHILVPAVPRLRAQYPAIQLVLVADLYDDSGPDPSASLSLRFDQQAGKHQVSREIGAFTYAIYGPAKTDAKNLPWIGFEAGKNLYAPTDWLHRHGVDSNDICLMANDAAIIRDGIRAGIGKSVIPEFLGDSDPELQRLTVGPAEFTRKLRWIINSNATTLPGVGVVIDWLEQTLSAVSALPANRARTKPLPQSGPPGAK